MEKKNIKTKDLVYSKKEILAMLNNCVIFQQQYMKDNAARQTRLREYASALIEPVVEHSSEGLLTKEESVFILSAAALLCFMKTNDIKKLPAQELAEKVVDIGD
ncbi:hypothetical protein UFOVP434_29 [uncultured Caudovirales phage]|uniref:Uncharacterized protein n=1 Tax=uncultured Caudovirales phage TaxID=2100421 RepID=A0A6J5M7F9_9CAUD|nr:hypothetical protein UFOVP434_29 [uncultured Caudovirales phage]